MKKKRTNLIEARKRKKLKQHQIAFQMETQKTVISNWENCIATPRLYDALRLAEILDEDVSTLFLEFEVQESQT